MVFAIGSGSEAILAPLQAPFSPVHVFVLLAAYLLVVWPSGLLIGRIIRRWKRAPPAAAPDHLQSLDKAGRWIGYLERILILTFILLQEYTAIGFLVTAKSIFRFEATRQEGGVHPARDAAQFQRRHPRGSPGRCGSLSRLLKREPPSSLSSRWPRGWRGMSEGGIKCGRHPGTMETKQ